MAGKVNDAATKNPEKLKPGKQHNAGIASQIVITPAIMAQRELYTGTPGDNDGIAFTLYVAPTANSAGVFEIEYDVTFSSPLPF